MKSSSVQWGPRLSPVGGKGRSWETGDYSKQKTSLNPREREGTTEDRDGESSSGEWGKRAAWGEGWFSLGIEPLIARLCVSRNDPARGVGIGRGAGCLEGSMVGTPQNRPGGRTQMGAGGVTGELSGLPVRLCSLRPEASRWRRGRTEDQVWNHH